METIFTHPAIHDDGTIAFLKKKEHCCWCRCSVDHWIMTYWEGFIGVGKESLEEAFYHYVKQYEVTTDVLSAFFREQIHANDYWGIRDNLPYVYIDFDQRLFLSTFYDIPLENRVLESWTGKYAPFDNLIPEKKKYWMIDGKDWMAEIFQKQV